VTPVPLDLPLRPSEAAELASLVFDAAERKPLTDDVRNRIAARAAALKFETIVPHFGSLNRDPVHHSTYYIAVDVNAGPPQLLHMALAAAPTSSIFHKPLLIGRMRRSPGPEIVVNAIPFGPGDSDALEKFAAQIDPAVLPRPYGSRTTIVAELHGGGAVAAGVFDAFRRIWKRTGQNVAAIGAGAGEPAGAVYAAGLWAAIRSGWRQGYGAVVRIPAGGSTPFDAVKEAVREAVQFSTFSVDPTAAMRETEGQTDEALNELFDVIFPADDRGWIFDEFAGKYEFTPSEVVRLAVRLGESLLLCERAHAQIRQVRSALKINRKFDLELALDAGASATTPRELTFALHWLRARGYAAQLVSPHLRGSDEALVCELAAICRHFQCGLDFRAEAEQIETVSRATGGRMVCSLWDGDVNGAAIERAAESLIG
jgi:hypothetical protein